MSGLTSARKFRLLLFHHSRCTTTHNGRVKPVKSPTVTRLCARVHNNFIYYMYIARENKPKSMYMYMRLYAPNAMFFGHFFYLYFYYYYYYFFTVRKPNHKYISQ